MEWSPTVSHGIPDHNRTDATGASPNEGLRSDCKYGAVPYRRSHKK